MEEDVQNGSQEKDVENDYICVLSEFPKMRNGSLGAIATIKHNNYLKADSPPQHSKFRVRPG